MGLAAACPIGAPSTSHTDVVVSVGFSPGRILVAGASPFHSRSPLPPAASSSVQHRDRDRASKHRLGNSNVPTPSQRPRHDHDVIRRAATRAALGGGARAPPELLKLASQPQFPGALGQRHHTNSRLLTSEASDNGPRLGGSEPLALAHWPMLRRTGPSEGSAGGTQPTGELREPVSRFSWSSNRSQVLLVGLRRSSDLARTRMGFVLSGWAQ